MALLVNLLVEEGLLEIEPKGDGAHHIHMEIVARLVEVQRGLLEAWSVAFLRPLVFPGLIPVTADLHALFEVGSLGTQLSDFVRVGRLGNTFTADPDIAPVRAGILPCKLVLRI